jgi:hypothetical protein
LPPGASTAAPSGVASKGLPEQLARAMRAIQRTVWHDFATLEPPSIQVIPAG